VRILYHHRTLGDGAEGIHIREMVHALRGLGHEVEVAALVGEPQEAVTSRRSRWAAVARVVPAVGYEFAEIASNVVARATLRAAVRRFRPDVIYDRYNSYSTAAAVVGRRYRIPVLLEVNAPIAYERTAYDQHQLRMPKLAARYEQWICRSVDHVFVVSTPLARFLAAERGVDPASMSVLPNAANPGTFRMVDGAEAMRDRLSLGNRVVLGFVGILRPWHGVDLFLRAVAVLLGRGYDIHALIVGDGPMEVALRRLAVDSGIGDRVTFTGRVPHESVRAYIAAMDVAVSPRATFYASPMKILEYMAMAKPVVGPAMENIRDLIEDGRTGQLFAPEDCGDLVRRLEELIVSRERRQMIGAAARSEIERHRTWEKNGEIVANTARRLVASGAAALKRHATT
jgi:glycosyltransferase involved in cell wall biosynthesis